MAGYFHLREVKFTFPVIRRSAPAVLWAALVAILQLVIILPLADSPMQPKLPGKVETLLVKVSVKRRERCDVISGVRGKDVL